MLRDSLLCNNPETVKRPALGGSNSNLFLRKAGVELVSRFSGCFFGGSGWNTPAFYPNIGVEKKQEKYVGIGTLDGYRCIHGRSDPFTGYFCGAWQVQFSNSRPDLPSTCSKPDKFHPFFSLATGKIQK